ncbi:uncharacterized, partial [Tachysurus ichikawai]
MLDDRYGKKHNKKSQRKEKQECRQSRSSSSSTRSSVERQHALGLTEIRHLGEKKLKEKNKLIQEENHRELQK